MSSTLYQEETRYRGWRILGMAALLLIPLGFVWASHIQYELFFGQSFETLTLVSVISLLFLAGYAYFIRQARLYTEIDAEGIHYQFYPVHGEQHHIDWDEVVGYRVVRTSLLGHLCGWGVNFSTQEPRYSVSGRNGLELFLKGGERIFIGSARPKRIRKVLKKKVKLPERLALAG